MSNYRRSHEGRVYFFTVVTYRRQHILTDDNSRILLRVALERVRQDRPFTNLALVLLPDHLHAVWELPPGDSDYATRWRRIKSIFTTNWLAAGGFSAPVSKSRLRREERGVWQRRFFEHTCRDEQDLKRCIDYVHVNPLKHGLVERVVDWPWSTFHGYVESGEYTQDWGSAAEWYGDEFAGFE